MIIRPYATEDCLSLIEVFRASVRKTGLRFYSPAQVIAWAPDEIDAAQFNARRLDRQTWVAESDGKPVGFSDLEADGHVDMLYVHPDHQGQGIARSLLRFVESVACEKKISRLYTEASVGARPVFELAGFRVIAGQTVSHNGQTFENYRMEKILDSDRSTR